MSKHVIDGKIYNTETATEIAEYHTGGSMGDFYYCYETLYRSPKGTFFIDGEGGAATRWGDGTCAGRGAIVITRDDALAWCERQNVNGETIEKFFDLEIG